MGGKLSPLVAALCTLFFTASLGCDEPKKFASGGNYTTCEEGVIVDFSDNQKVICDDLKAGVEELCGFDLTVEPCTCATALAACTGDTDWLQAILSCRTGAGNCVEYITCLEGVGASPSGCPDPTTWECIVSSTDTDSQ